MPSFYRNLRNIFTNNIIMQMFQKVYFMKHLFFYLFLEISLLHLEVTGDKE